jgi:hypothetical protein
MARNLLLAKNTQPAFIAGPPAAGSGAHAMLMF